LLGVVACGRQDAARVASYEPEALAPIEAPAPAVTSPCAADISLGPGLQHERRMIPTTQPSPAGATPCLDVVRADLATYRLRVLTSARDGNGSHPAPWWRDTFRLVAVTNAGMFHEGGDPVGLIVEDGVTLGRDNKTFAGYFAFDDAGNATIGGRDCPGFDLAELRTKYRSIVQSGRLLGCNGQALPWKDKKQYSAAAIGLSADKKQVVFLHARDAVTMTELAAAVAELELSGALFLEGGPEASLVVRGSKSELARVGSFETGFVENNDNQSFWWLPNVIALEAR
jgi:hypothetical protein